MDNYKISIRYCVRCLLSLLMVGSLVWASPCMAQQQSNRDYRAELNLSGGFPSFTLAPDGNCWFMSGEGRGYYTKDIRSFWHPATPIFPSGKEKWTDHARITFINSDTAIVTFSTPSINSNKYYLTHNGANSWMEKTLEGKEMFYCKMTCVDEQGHVWLGGSGYGDILYFSEDYGNTFSPIPIDLEEHYWSMISALDMRDLHHGIAGVEWYSRDVYRSRNWRLLLTEDNWQTVQPIPTPVNRAISKVLFWRDLWVIQQGDEVFYTSSQKVEWERLPANVVDFFPDKEGGNLIGITEAKQVVIFESPTEYHLLCEEALPGRPADAYMFHGELYTWTAGRYLCQVDSDGAWVVKEFYTNEETIQVHPNCVRGGENLYWAIEWNTIYLADRKDGRWWRHRYLPIIVTKYKLMSDSLALLWDGKQHYTYSLADDSLRPYTLSQPLQEFLKSPVKEVMITSGLTDQQEDTIRYQVGRDGRLHTTQALLTSIQKNHYCSDCPIKIAQKRLKFNHGTSIDELTSILNDISHDPSHIPTIEEMQITDKDKGNYLRLVNKIDFVHLANHLIREFSLRDEYVWLSLEQRAEMKRFYRSVANQIDTVGLSTIKTALYNTTGFSTGGAYWFKIEMVNGEGDTLVFQHFNHYHDYAWYLPWMVECDGMRFECRNPALSRWVAACVPKKFYGSKCFDNALFIMQVANWLWMQGWWN